MPPGKLATLRARAKREGWAHMIRTAADERALLEGCTFDVARAEHVAEFGRRYIRHSLGRWAGQPFELLVWQRDEIIFPLFGWIRPDGKRRFRRAFVFIPKKNGKSALCSLLTLYLLAGDGEPRAEVYATAVDRSQSSIVFNESAAMVKGSPELARRLKIIETTKTILFGMNRYTALSGEDASSEGKNIHGLICDELHAWNTPKLRKLYASLYYGTAAREQPLSIVITTAGEDDEETLWREEYDHARAILEGNSEDTQRLAVIYEASEEDVKDEGWLDPRVHAKANPSYGQIIAADEMAAAAEEARTSPRKRAMFFRYRLNRPQSLTVEWLDAAEWDKGNAAPDFPEGCECFGGIDLGSTDDLTALVLLRRELAATEEEDLYHLLAWIFCPEETVRRKLQEGSHLYQTWAEQKWLTVTPGNVVDYRFIQATVLEAGAKYSIREIGYDPWAATETAIELGDTHGLTMVEVRQGAKSLSEPMKKLERVAKSGRLRHGANPILAWMCKNTRAKSDESGNIRPVKPPGESAKKIDGVVATITAMSRAMVAVENRSVYETRGVLTL